ncbi:AfsR/SARP family transcriptional regulator [Kutzneria albida]|uniref:Bacterial transcriptional activator domain-containing protein n=1 Tax=Kutzneria albida DSM 43870 TaxID=1449976 RepID=W5W0M6_9PSEU|nr:BTAD domain-containing putative transcriptional regulator [Kutzneria albida]AHH94713.1 hypothetical protein KALB_1340 [Kutzneria albida DSM 43870]
MSERPSLVLLDGFALSVRGQHVELARSLQRLLAYVALHRVPSRLRTAAALWPDPQAERSLSRLRTALWRTSRLAVPVLVAEGERLRLAPQVRLDLDQLTKGREQRLAALVRRRHELLPGWYEDWVLERRQHTKLLYLRALERAAERELRQARYGRAVEATMAALRTEPLRETPHRLLIEIHLAEGNYTEALAAYQSYQRLLREELGIGPAPHVQQLVRRPPC